MPLTSEIDISRLVIQLEALENRLQNGERSVKLQMEAQQMIRKATDARFLQPNWRQEIVSRAQHIVELCSQQKTEAE